MNKVCPHCKMEHIITNNRKYCDADCFKVSRMSNRVDDTFELKPRFKEEINKKLKGFYSADMKLTKQEKATASGLIKKKSLPWLKLNHPELYRRFKYRSVE